MFNTLENKSSSWIKLIGLTYVCPVYFPYFDLIEVSRLVVGGSTVKKNIYKSLRCLPDLAINRINRYNILCSKPIDLLTEQIASASLRGAENRNERLEGERTKEEERFVASKEISSFSYRLDVTIGVSDRK